MLRVLILAGKVPAREEEKGKEKDFFFKIILSMVFSPAAKRLNSASENNCFRFFYSNSCGC